MHTCSPSPHSLFSLSWGGGHAGPPHPPGRPQLSFQSLERTNKLCSRPKSPSSKNRVLKIQMYPRKFLKMWSMFS